MAAPLVLKTNVISDDPNKQRPVRDVLLRGDNGGVRCLFDLAFGWSYSGAPTGTPPANGAAVRDISERFGDLVWSLKAGQAVTYAGGSVDFSSLTDDPVDLRSPSGVLSSIWNSANQYFMVAMYGKLPADADWTTWAGGIETMFTCLNVTAPPSAAQAELVTIGQYPTKLLQGIRHIGGTSTEVASLTVPTALLGKFAQIVYARQASGIVLRVRGVDGEVLATRAVGSNNTVDFSARQPQWGVPDAFNAIAAQPTQRTGVKRTLSRGFIEDLSLSGRNALAVADADWARVIARGVFS